MTAVNVEVLEELGKLIEDLTTTGKPGLDEKQIKRVKNICKTSNSYVNHTYHILTTQLKKKHSEIRFSCLQIICELFTRSHTFRELILAEFQKFLELVVGTDPNVPLPPPTKTAKTMREKAVEAIESWHQKYGSHYKKLDLGYHYLKRIKHVEFAAISSRSLAERRHAEERERRRQVILQKKIDKAENEIAEHTGHIELCLTEINNCFKLLLPHPDDYEVHLEIVNQDSSLKSHDNDVASTTSTEDKKKETSDDTACHDECYDDDDACKNNSQYTCNINESFEIESTSTDLIKDHGLGSRSYELNLQVNECQPSIDETEDNFVILNTAREMYKEIMHKYLPMVNQWLQVFTKVGHSHQRILSIIDIKRQLQSAKQKFDELNISPTIKSEENKEAQKEDNEEEEEKEKEEEEEEEEEFEDVPEKEGIEYIPESKMAEYGLDTVLQKQASTCQNQSSLREDERFLKQFGFSLKDAEDPTSHARALLESRKKQRFLAERSATRVKHSDSSTDTSTKSSVDSPNSLKSEKRRELLKKAPVIPFDMDLYHWEDPNYDPPKIIKSHNFNNYWAANDTEPEHIFEEDKGSMLKRTIPFPGKFEPVKWSCRARLPNGKLCPRKDRIKCPFHGIIVPRDDKGRPFGERHSDEGSTSAPSTSMNLNQSNNCNNDWKEIQQDIEAATGIDLRKRTKRQRGRKKKDGTSEKEMSRKQKYSRLADIHKTSKSPRSRLEKKVLSRDSLKRVAEEMDNLATKKFLDKYGDQFNYQLRK